MHQQPQTSFSIFHFQKEHADNENARGQQYMEKNYNKTITVTEMAGISNMSSRNLIRRFEQATSNTPLGVPAALQDRKCKKDAGKQELWI